MRTKIKSGSTDDRYVIVMAGGRGERFWPVSRAKRPKQLVKLLGGRSLLQQAVDNAASVVPLENIFIVTNAAQVAQVRRQLPKLPRRNIVGEPCGRDTCAAVALGAALVGGRSRESVMAVLPADHVIPEKEKFQQVLSDALDLAGRCKAIVTIGIKPTEPSTGYGYIRAGNPWPTPPGRKPYQTAFLKAERFVEKPNLETAIEYLRSGLYRWNAGMFIWSLDTIVEGLATHQPGIADACQRWMASPGSADLARMLADDYPRLTRISIDYALMEHAQNVVVANGDFAWDDLGSWTALGRHLQADAQGNSVAADLVALESSANIVFDARVKNRTVIGLVGVSDTIVVCADDAVLVAHRAQAQKVKELVRLLEASAGRRKLI